MSSPLPASPLPVEVLLNIRIKISGGLQVKTKTRKITSIRNCVQHGDTVGCLGTEEEESTWGTTHSTIPHPDSSASRRGPVLHLQCSATTLSVCFHRRTCWHLGYDYQRLRGLWMSGGVTKCPAMTGN